MAAATYLRLYVGADKKTLLSSREITSCVLMTTDCENQQEGVRDRPSYAIIHLWWCH
jgi:hypothetical protein